MLGVSDFIIGITIVTLGTSLPELASDSYASYIDQGHYWQGWIHLLILTLASAFILVSGGIGWVVAMSAPEIIFEKRGLGLRTS